MIGVVRQHLVHLGRPGWTRLELATGAADDFRARRKLVALGYHIAARWRRLPAEEPFEIVLARRLTILASVPEGKLRIDYDTSL